jgi:heptosyltransferase-2
MNNHPRNILIRGVNWIGDAVLTIPAIQAVRKTFPDAHISLLVKPWVADIFSSSHDIDEIILYEDIYKGIKGKLRLAKMLKLKKFNTAVLFQNAFDAALITWLAGIPERIGYNTDFRSLLLTNAVPLTKDILTQHQVHYYINIVSAIGVASMETAPYLSLTREERNWAIKELESFNAAQLPVIGINPGATYGSAKRWLPERFAELIINIIDKLNGKVILFGSQSEAAAANEIAHNINAHSSDTTHYSSHILNMAGKTGLRELAALISECDAFVTNDSGPMHMASALLVPTVAIFGSTNKKATAPFGDGHKVVSKDLPCAPCMKRECPEGHLKCMTEINAGEIFEAVKELLPRRKAVFLDKDGTIIEDKNYLNSFDDMVILPDASEGLAELKKGGYKLIGITNQSGIARGLVDESFVKESNNYLEKELGMDDFYYCPHHPDECCSCRKPAPLMLLKAKLQHGIDLKASYMIGDKESDVLLGNKAGVTGILLSSSIPDRTKASYVAKDLEEAVKWILNRQD